jgi:hypothetical protein
MFPRRIPTQIKGFPKSFALISDGGHAETAVIFVHGFGGSPTGTWQDFHGLIDEDPQTRELWNRSDIFFFSYDSVRTPIGVNAQRLASFLDEVLKPAHSDESVVSGTIQSPDPGLASEHLARSKVRNLVWAAHSEGAVVIRRLILDRFATLMRREAVFKGNARGVKSKNRSIKAHAKHDLVLNSTLRFFAPACLGTNFSSFFGFALSLSALASAIAASSTVRNELLPESPILRQIREDTESGAREFASVSGFSSKVLFGDRDQIVFTGAYNCDEIKYVDGHDHFSICKPKCDYKLPLEFVLS